LPGGLASPSSRSRACRIAATSAGPMRATSAATPSMAAPNAVPSWRVPSSERKLRATRNRELGTGNSEPGTRNSDLRLDRVVPTPGDHLLADASRLAVAPHQHRVRPGRQLALDARQ